jgi:NADH-ubiquinone oxidoreductase chain 5
MAMAAPTPVSALVHSSTLVTAGVYLLIRFFPAIREYPQVTRALLLLRRLTMVLAGFAAFTEMDFKKIIAYSTLRQLGVIMVALGLGRPFLSFFHLLSHAMFKALMFICAGTYIYYHKHGQDLRVMGNLRHYLPVTQLGLVVSNLALCGFPFLSGFYSKDPVYEFRVRGRYNIIVTFFMALGLLLTRVYSARAIMISQIGPSNQTALNCYNNNSTFFRLPILLLGSLAMVWGAALN